MKITLIILNAQESREAGLQPPSAEIKSIIHHYHQVHKWSYSNEYVFLLKTKKEENINRTETEKRSKPTTKQHKKLASMPLLNLFVKLL